MLLFDSVEGKAKNEKVRRIGDDVWKDDYIFSPSIENHFLWPNYKYFLLPVEEMACCGAHVVV
jgi:hypothetical protein